MASFRQLASTLDPVRPATRLIGTPPADDLDWYATGAGTDTAALHHAIRTTTDGAVGLFEHSDKGLAQAFRGGSLAPAGTTGSSATTLAGPTPRRPVSLRAMADRLGSAMPLTLLVWNTWLIDPPVSTPPARSARAREIPDRLAALAPDILVLNEVFKKADREAVLAALPATSDAREGPGRRGIEISSGLQAVVRHPLTIGRSATHVYEHNGGLPDSLAQKGVLHVEVETRQGSIDLFVTHMDAEDRDDDGQSEARRLQADELLDFIDRRRRAANVVVVAGDLNVDGRFDEYTTLVEQLSSGPGGLELEDCWLTRGSRFGATAKVHDFDGICTLDEAGYCRDHETANVPGTASDRQPGYRLDYVFIERPRPTHNVTVDLGRMRRRPFWRGADFPPEVFSHRVRVGQQTLEIPHYLSDHLALEVPLFVGRAGG